MNGIHFINTLSIIVNIIIRCISSEDYCNITINRIEHILLMKDDWKTFKIYFQLVFILKKLRNDSLISFSCISLIIHFFLKESDAFPSIKCMIYILEYYYVACKFIFNDTKSPNKTFCKISIFVKLFNIYWTTSTRVITQRIFTLHNLPCVTLKHDFITKT